MHVTVTYKKHFEFQHTAARRRLLAILAFTTKDDAFQHTAARRRLPGWRLKRNNDGIVSTHSRAEAAAKKMVKRVCIMKFQHTAARRRLLLDWEIR